MQQPRRRVSNPRLDGPRAGLSPRRARRRPVLRHLPDRPRRLERGPVALRSTVLTGPAGARPPAASPPRMPRLDSPWRAVPSGAPAGSVVAVRRSGLGAGVSSARTPAWSSVGRGGRRSRWTRRGLAAGGRRRGVGAGRRGGRGGRGGVRRRVGRRARRCGCCRGRTGGWRGARTPGSRRDRRRGRARVGPVEDCVGVGDVAVGVGVTDVARRGRRCRAVCRRRRCRCRRGRPWARPADRSRWWVAAPLSRLGGCRRGRRPRLATVGWSDTSGVGTESGQDRGRLFDRRRRRRAGRRVGNRDGDHGAGAG